MRAAYEYDLAFLDVAAGNLPSAHVVLAALRSQLEVRSVVDFGCAEGAWLSVWQRLGVADVLGVDGPWVRKERLLIPSSRFVTADLGLPIRLGRSFDLVESVEVGEHLPASRATAYVENLVSHAPMVLFSAAPPGQGGEFHVNEQPYEYWRDLFLEKGYALVDGVRPAIAASDAMPWYRYNLFLFVRSDRLASLPPALAAYVRGPTDPIPDVSPPAYRWRKRVFALLPAGTVTHLARLRARLRRRPRAS